MSEWKEVDTVCTGENYKIVIEMIQRPMYRWHAWSADRRKNERMNRKLVYVE